MSDTNDIPLYGTHGGIATFAKGRFVWSRVPKGSEFEVGDEVPVDWSFQPLNDAAVKQMRRDTTLFLNHDFDDPDPI